LSSATSIIYSGRTTPRGNKIGKEEETLKTGNTNTAGVTTGQSIYNNSARQAERKNNSQGVVTNPVIPQAANAGSNSSNNGLVTIKTKGSSGPTNVSTVDHNYTGVNDSSPYPYWDEEVLRTSGNVVSGLGESVFEAVKPVAQAAKKVYDRVNGYVDVSDITMMPYNLMTEGTRLDDDYYLTEEEKRKRDELGYKEILGVGIGKGNEYLNSLEEEIERRKGEEIAKIINSTDNDLIKYIGSFLLSPLAGIEEGKNDLKNAFYSVVGEGETAPRSGISIAADATRVNLGGIDALLADTARYAGSKYLPIMAGSASPALGKAVYGLGELGEGYEHGIEAGATPQEALASATGEALINTALEYGFGNIGGVSKAMTPVKEEIADKAFDVLKLVVKDKSIAKEMGEAVAVAVSSTIGAELEVNAERYLRNIYLGENNEISFTDREVVENVIISIAIDEAFELADKGEIELKSGKDLKSVEFDTGKGYDVGDIKTYSIENSFLNNLSKLDEIFSSPDSLSIISGDDMYRYLKEKSYDVYPLSRGSAKGVLFEDGGGFKVNWGGDRIIQYHPSKGSHHSGAYFKISSGETGTIRINLEKGDN